MSSGNDTSTANTTANYPICGWAVKDTTETNRQIVYRSAGIFQNLFVRLGSNSVSLATTFTFRINATNGNQTISVASGATGIFEDLVNTDTIVSGDKVNLQAIPGSGSTGTFQPAVIALLFSPPNINTVTRLANEGLNNNQSTASATNFFPLVGACDWIGTETQAQCIQEKAGTFKNMAVNISANSNTNAATFTLRNNTASVNNTISVGSSVTGFVEDLTHSDSVVTGDKVDIMFVTGAATVNITVSGVQIDFVSTTNTTQIISGRSNGAGYGINTNGFLYLGGIVGFSAGGNETWEQYELRNGYTFSFLSCNVSANTISATSTLTFRKNAADGNQTLSIGSNLSGFFTDTTNTDVAVTTDLVDIKLITGGSGTTLTLVNISVWSTVPIITPFRLFDQHNLSSSLMFIGM